jgi:hypothetical protein
MSAALRNGKFGRIWEHVAQIVAGALNVQRRVGDATERPAAIFHAANRAADTEAGRIGLYFLMQLRLAKSEGRAEKKFAFLVELGERIVTGSAVAVCPIGVTGA